MILAHPRAAATPPTALRKSPAPPPGDPHPLGLAESSSAPSRYAATAPGVAILGGSVTTNVVPVPAVLVHVTWPPSSST